jgi:hypothetical protein
MNDGRRPAEVRQERLGRGRPVEHATRARVDPMRDVVEIGRGEPAKVRTLGEVLP